MVEFVKQSMADVWASAGDVVMPDTSKIQEGWLVEVPPRQYWNWMQNRTDTNLAYIFQRGIPSWDNTVEYIVNKSFVVHNGVVYRALLTGTNQEPGVATTYWKKAFSDSTAVSEAVGGLTPAADRYIYFTGPTTAATGTITSFARTILDDANASAVRTTIGAQQADATLTALSGLATDTNKLPYFTAVDAAAVTDLTAFGRSLIDDANASDARTTLGLGTISTQAANNVAITGGSITGITDLAIADGGTGSSTAAGARTNLGLGSAAVEDVQTSATDTTAGRVLTTGAFGLGTIGTTSSDLNAISVSGFYRAGSTTTGIPGVATILGYNVYYQGDADFGTMTAWGYDSSRVFQRHRQSGNWSTWRETVTAAGQNFTGDDLNDLLDGGFYYASNASPVNYPSTYNSGLVVVTNSTSSNVRTQLFFPIGARDKMFFRTFFSTWGAWQEVFTASNQLALGTTAASGRTALGLGTASTAAVTTSATDTTAGSLLKVGDFGVGSANAPSVANLNTLARTGFYRCTGAATGSPDGVNSYTVVHQQYDTSATQIAITAGSSSGRAWVRTSAAGSWGSWREFAENDSGWLTPTLVNAWVQVDSTSFPVRYRKIGNRVMLQGLVRNDTLSNNNVEAFTLPAGYRPTQTHYFEQAGGLFLSSDGACAITADGTVTPNQRAASAAPIFMSLDGISFMVN